MAKYLREEEKKTPKNKKRNILIALALLVVVGIVLLMTGNQDITMLNLSGAADPTIPTAPTIQESQPAAAAPGAPAEMEPFALSEELKILMISDFAGMYMEDGSNETVTDVMMILVENTSDKDLQLARIDLVYGDFTANFEITNLPAGEKLVALERNRHAAPSVEPESAELNNVVFFEEPMTLREEGLEISGSDGYMEVKNISGEDISGNIYIYYKYSATDLLYGGITFRVVIEGGLAADQTAQLFSGHYSPEGSRIVSVAYGA